MSEIDTFATSEQRVPPAVGLSWTEATSALRAEISTTVVGQERLINRLLIGMLCDGHVLLEGLPGLAKTTAVRAFATALHCRFRRVQFTPDLLPSDILGTLVFHPATGEFRTQKGPIFTNVLLADEINRSPAKTQAAMLEAMAERQVTLGDESYRLPEPFLVLATQNPIEQEGTYRLPEAQLDRFMLKVRVDYPGEEEEHRILEMALESRRQRASAPVWSLEQLAAAKEAVATVALSGQLRRYIVSLVHTSRTGPHQPASLQGLIRVGGSPRATINLACAGRAHAFLHGRDHVLPDDIQEVAMDVMQHRIIPSYEAEAEGLEAADLVGRLLEVVPVP